MKNSKFTDINLSRETLKGIEKLGFTEMTPIQQDSIPTLLEGRDLIGQAQTGTGKTLAFGLPVIEKVDTSFKKVQALILCPTRELSMQVAEEISKVARYHNDLKVLPIFGGESITRQIRELKRGVQVVVGTPGRVIDHINRKTLKLDDVVMMVLDEADEMFDMGFRDDIKYVMDRLNDERQTIFFSATMPKAIINFAKRYQQDPEIIRVTKEELTTKNIEEYYLELRENEKSEVLSRLIEVDSPKLVVVFTNTKRKVDNLALELQNRGYKSEGLHGDLTQSQRDKVMKKFRNGNIQILVATDVAARGIDVDDVDMVVNFDVPQNEEYYVHRIGRTGRAGRKGISYSFVTSRDRRKLRDIERYTKVRIDKKPIPKKEDLLKLKENELLEDVKKQLEKNKQSNKDLLLRIMSEGNEPFDVALALLNMYVDTTVGTVEEIREIPEVINRKDRKSNNDKSGKKNLKNKDKGRVYINVGKNKNIRPSNIVAAIVEHTDVDGDSIGGIDIYDKFSFVDIEKSQVGNVVEKLNNKKINRVTVAVERANKR